MTNQEMKAAKRGDKIKANGYEGSFINIYDLGGMVEVRLPGGCACVPIEDVELIEQN